MFQEVNRRSVSDEVYDQLCSRIVSQDLKAGEELPSERLLSEMLGVSRNAVREAIKRLQQARLVDVKHGGLTTVLDYRAEAGAELLPSLLFDQHSNIQVDVARSIVRMRQVLSPEIAADAARQKKADIADRLDTVIEQMRTLNEPSDVQRLAFHFWEILVEGSGNIAYRLAFNSLRKTYEPLWGLMTQMLSGQQQKLDVFIKLASLVRAGNPDEAAAWAREYIDESSAAINGFLDLYENSARDHSNNSTGGKPS